MAASESAPAAASARCWWCAGDAAYVAYHDTDWGRPVAGDNALFEKICLEGFQAGLSWLTILRKRDNFRRCFANFDIESVARFGESDVVRLLGDAGIVRHRGKIEAAIHNARRVSHVIDQHGSLAALAWRFEPDPASRPPLLTREILCAQPTTPESTALSKMLRKLDFRFVGPTTCYAFMQAMGLVNDHLSDCPQRAEVEMLRAQFTRP